MGGPLSYVIFTDASRRLYDDRVYCGYGVVILDLINRRYGEFGGELGGHTIVYGESYAIYRGIREVMDLVGDMRCRVLVVTDSKLNVEILTRYIPYIWDKTNPKCWKTARGEPVKNQEIYKRILALLEKTPKMRLSVVHINSHRDQKTEWKRAQRKMWSKAVRTSKESAQMFMEMNARADAIATSITRKMIQLERSDGKFMRLVRKDENYEGT